MEFKTKDDAFALTAINEPIKPKFKPKLKTSFSLVNKKQQVIKSEAEILVNMPQEDKSNLTKLKPALQRCKTESVGIIAFDRARKAFPLKLTSENVNKIPKQFKFQKHLMEFKAPDYKVQARQKSMGGKVKQQAQQINYGFTNN